MDRKWMWGSPMFGNMFGNLLGGAVSPDQLPEKTGDAADKYRSAMRTIVLDARRKAFDSGTTGKLIADELEGFLDARGTLEPSTGANANALISAISAFRNNTVNEALVERVLTCLEDPGCVKSAKDVVSGKAAKEAEAARVLEQQKQAAAIQAVEEEQERKDAERRAQEARKREEEEAARRKEKEDKEAKRRMEIEGAKKRIEHEGSLVGAVRQCIRGGHGPPLGTSPPPPYDESVASFCDAAIRAHCHDPDKYGTYDRAIKAVLAYADNVITSTSAGRGANPAFADAQNSLEDLRTETGNSCLVKYNEVDNANGRLGCLYAILSRLLQTLDKVSPVRYVLSIRDSVDPNEGRDRGTVITDALGGMCSVGDMKACHGHLFYKVVDASAKGEVQDDIIYNMATSDITSLINKSGPNCLVYTGYGYSGSGKTYTLLSKDNKNSVLRAIMTTAQIQGCVVDLAVTDYYREENPDDTDDVCHANTIGSFHQVARYTPSLGRIESQGAKHEDVSPDSVVHTGAWFDGTNMDQCIRSISELQQFKGGKNFGSPTHHMFHIRKTPFNPESSRAHTIFAMDIKRRDGNTVLGRVAIVDMAGTEDVRILQDHYFSTVQIKYKHVQVKQGEYQMDPAPLGETLDKLVRGRTTARDIKQAIELMFAQFCSSNKCKTFLRKRGLELNGGFSVGEFVQELDFMDLKEMKFDVMSRSHDQNRAWQELGQAATSDIATSVTNVTGDPPCVFEALMAYEAYIGLLGTLFLIHAFQYATLYLRGFQPFNGGPFIYGTSGQQVTISKSIFTNNLHLHSPVHQPEAKDSEYVTLSGKTWSGFAGLNWEDKHEGAGYKWPKTFEYPSSGPLPAKWPYAWAYHQKLDMNGGIAKAFCNLTKYLPLVDVIVADRFDRYVKALSTHIEETRGLVESALDEAIAVKSDHTEYLHTLRHGGIFKQALSPTFRDNAMIGQAGAETKLSALSRFLRGNGNVEVSGAVGTWTPKGAPKGNADSRIGAFNLTVNMSQSFKDRFDQVEKAHAIAQESIVACHCPLKRQGIAIQKTIGETRRYMQQVAAFDQSSPPAWMKATIGNVDAHDQQLKIINILNSRPDAEAVKAVVESLNESRAP